MLLAELPSLLMLAPAPPISRGCRGRCAAQDPRARRRPWALLALLMVAATMSASAPARAEVPPDGGEAVAARLSTSRKLEGRVRERLPAMSASDELAISVTLLETGLPDRTRAAARRAEVALSQQRIFDALPSRGHRLGRRYENLAGFSLHASPEVIEALARDPSVASIYLDGRVHEAMNQGRRLIGADVATNAGFTGAGVAVAVLDSGIDTDHPDLQDDLVAERCWCSDGGSPHFGCCPTGGETGSGPGSAEDDRGHGTSVSGIITSAGSVAHLGVAADAGVVALKVLGPSGGGNFSDVAAALDWVLTNGPALGVRVVNLSFGDQQEWSDGSASPCSGTNTANAIDDLVAAGVSVFVSSGNNSFDAGVSFPACVPSAISVGGVYDASLSKVDWCGDTCDTILCTDSPAWADSFVCHTNSDESLDLLAPDFQTSTTDLGGTRIQQFGGTSAAAPYAAAVAVLLLEQDPARTPADLRALLTSGPLIENPDNGLSFPRIDVGSVFSVCGNGIVEGDEECDQASASASGCCSSACLFEPSGTACDDSEPCTGPDACDGAGSCTGGLIDCSDGTFCNGAEVCVSGVGCQPGPAPPVDDGIGCTVDVCDEASASVLHIPNDQVCDDGLFCDGAESCDADLGCVAGSPPVIDDGVGCTVDGCDEALDVVTHVPDDGYCDDEAWCNGVETCDAQIGCLGGAPPPVDDGIDCTIDVCDEVGDTTSNVPDDLACDDEDECTADSCDAITGCAHTPIPGCGVQAVPTAPSPWPLAAALLLVAWASHLHLARAARVEEP